MSFIIIELHGGPEYAIIVTNQDGDNLVFETREEPKQRRQTAKTD
jgi:hypothetical protein